MNINSTVIDAMARRVAVSRRGSLRYLAAAAATGALAVPTAAAGKGGKKDDENKQCKKQRGQCLEFVRNFCKLPSLASPSSQQEELETCEEIYGRCCDHLARCDAGKALTCFSTSPGAEM